MSLGTAIDVAIGLMFVYLLLGLLASAVQEAVAGLLNLRGMQLAKAILGMLGGEGATGAAASLFEKVQGHPLLAGASAKRKPSYIAPAQFALAMVEALRDGGTLPVFAQVEAGIQRLPQGSARQCLEALAVEAAGDLEAFKAGVAVWFSQAMDRLSGAYKRFSQYFAIGLGLALAVLCNIDSIAIAKSLWTDSHARALIDAAAQAYVEKHPDLTPQQVATELSELPVPIGWPKGLFQGFQWWALLGWPLTAFATSLGAPFWFDILQRVIKLRASGPKPEPAEGATEAPQS